MKGQRFTPERIIGLLRQAEVELAQDKRVGEVCRGLGDFGATRPSYDWPAPLDPAQSALGAQ